MPSDYVPLLILFAIAAVIAAVMVGGSWLLGPKRPSLAKGSPYECGITPVGSARERFPSRSGGNLQEGGNCKLRPCDWYKNPPRGRGGSRGSSPVHGGGWEGGMLKNQRKGTCYTAKARLVNIAVAAASVQARAFSIRYNSFRCRAIMCRC